MRRRPPPYLTEDDAVVVISDKAQEPSLKRRVLRLFGEAVAWFLTLTPGVLIIVKGLGGIVEKRLVMSGRFVYRNVSRGNDAVGLGWILVGVGFWALGQFCYLKTNRTVMKFLGWTFAVIAGVIGVWVLLKGSDNSSG